MVRSIKFPSASRIGADYGMLLVLVLLCAYYSWATLEEQPPDGAAGATQLARQLQQRFPEGARLFVVTRDNPEDRELAAALPGALANRGFVIVGTAHGTPADARQALVQLATAGGAPVQAIVGSQPVGNWSVFEALREAHPALAGVAVIVPQSHRWPNFLKAGNLVNVANQIAVIAIIAIGMTLVIVGGGIDLSVGSLIALAAVTASLVIRDWAGAERATALGLTLSCGAAILLCAGVGLLSGLLVTAFGIPPFIATLAMMLVASGLAFIAAKGQSIYQLPESFIWLGRASTFGLPNAVWLMAILYAAAHVVMTRTVLGRQIYAVGGNAAAAHLSGVPVRRVVTTTYTLCGALAGLGGIVTASQLKSGSPTYGLMYELYVIAAVVVGGTSLSGGRGKIMGTLIGALIIAVIQNGMNLTRVESYTQKVVLGLVILGAVLLDALRRRGWRVWRRG